MDRRLLAKSRKLRPRARARLSVDVEPGDGNSVTRDLFKPLEEVQSPELLAGLNGMASNAAGALSFAPLFNERGNN